MIDQLKKMLNQIGLTATGSRITAASVKEFFNNDYVICCLCQYIIHYS